MLIALTVILIVLILLVCGDRGAKSIITTALHGCLLLAAVYLIYRGLPPVLVTAAACLLISAVTCFYQNDGDIKSRLAFLSVAAVILILTPFVYYIAEGAALGGFNSEQYEITDTNGYTRNIAMDMLALQISVMLIALIGTVVDIAIAITSSIYEIHQAGGAGDFGRLAASGFIASRAILNTSIHTIFYIYIAEYLTLMIQYVDEYSLVRLVNSKSFCQEFLSISISGLGCCLIVPAATLLSAAVFVDKKPRKRADKKKESV